MRQLSVTDVITSLVATLIKFRQSVSPKRNRVNVYNNDFANRDSSSKGIWFRCFRFKDRRDPSSLCRLALTIANPNWNGAVEVILGIHLRERSCINIYDIFVVCAAKGSGDGSIGSSLL